MKIIFLGTQGSGKSTQAKLLAEKLSTAYLEMGQLLRDRASGGDDLAKNLQKILDSGHLVENETTISILHEKLSSQDPVEGYVLDGFPRNFAQFNALDPDIDIVFYVKVSDEEATRRLMLRHRSDDTKETLEKRLEIYNRETEPLLEKFRQKEILKEVNGERSVEAIAREILQFVKGYKKYQ